MGLSSQVAGGKPCNAMSQFNLVLHGGIAYFPRPSGKFLHGAPMATHGGGEPDLLPPQLRIAQHHLLVSGGTAGTCSLRRVWLRHCMPCPAHVQSQTVRCDTTAMCLASKSLCRWPRCASP